MTYYISPYRRMSQLRQAVERMMEDAMAETPQNEREMALSVDVFTNDDGYEITALVPGLDAEDVAIEILNNTVTIRGEFKCVLPENSKFLLCELPNGPFSRVITLPTAVDSAKVDASIKNGVLKLYLPKAEAHRPKAIKVKAD
ncbi:MAG: Hsp20/alpha crystallin family protein [Anaerolineales bacterium]|jgi:HSP20 family protein|nr:Hsp20/alpha crystallin family protein [Anaerolineales bacterium]